MEYLRRQVDKMATMRKWNKLLGELKEYKQNIHKTVHCSGGKFTSEKSYSFREQSNYVVSSVPMNTEFTLPNFSKQRPVWCIIGPTEFQQNRNLIWTVGTVCMCFTYRSRSTSLFGSLDFFAWGNIWLPIC